MVYGTWLTENSFNLVGCGLSEEEFTKQHPGKKPVHANDLANDEDYDPENDPDNEPE